jgi:hypothetical protein
MLREPNLKTPSISIPTIFPSLPKKTLIIYLINFLTTPSYPEAYANLWPHANLWFVKQQPTYNKSSKTNLKTI